MNHYRASELCREDGRPAGLWHYVCIFSNGYTFPVGYCAEVCPGHTTPQEAEEHFRQWVLDHASFDGRLHKMQQECRICGNWTSRIAECGIGHEDWFILCNKHCNREGLSLVLEVSGEVWSSW